MMAHLLVSAAHKSSGKTTLSLGLCAALKKRGLAIQPFKKGPDYIDPMWLGRAAGMPCYNLDFYTSATDEILTTVAQHSANADLALIEGNKGLHDGLDLKGSNSNAALARLLGSPVVLVIDARGMTRGIAPLILGYQTFDTSVRIAGVILNKVSGARHESKLRNAVEHYTDLPVLGSVHRSPELQLEERHLGLMPSNEADDADRKIAAIAQSIARQVDVERVQQIAATANAISVHLLSQPTKSQPDVRIGLARDPAFGFYYPDDLNALRRAGACLVPINTLKDQHLPVIDGLFIGGGFPETQMEALEANASLRREIRAAIEAGLPTYAECGGLMYLSRRLTWNGRTCAMVGAIHADTVMERRPQGRGYVRLRETSHHLWPTTEPTNTVNEIRAHEFHYSRLDNLDPQLRFAYTMQRGVGINGKHDGIVYKHLLACYTHRRHTAHDPWTSRFVNFVRVQKKEKALVGT